ncbi:outer membrane protein OmpA-like peptidoglycan-associated protein [Sagittula marina]|uniref:Outer membrane protein OmpA-like peptidoglycan-associated protein n=1 Tax=Sagittula marina TaxID=943940 RepID=A0A7W6GS71_9RHOB|nr:OmpA family protein [Sagittula marina]MBB3985487.1 outer membrane protein OmpA-like peptidoglycan-associated protein [Sagittula marina]
MKTRKFLTASTAALALSVSSVAQAQNAAANLPNGQVNQIVDALTDLCATGEALPEALDCALVAEAQADPSKQPQLMDMAADLAADGVDLPASGKLMQLAQADTQATVAADANAEAAAPTEDDLAAALKAQAQAAADDLQAQADSAQAEAEETVAEAEAAAQAEAEQAAQAAAEAQQAAEADAEQAAQAQAEAEQAAQAEQEQAAQAEAEQADAEAAAQADAEAQAQADAEAQAQADAAAQADAEAAQQADTTTDPLPQVEAAENADAAAGADVASEGNAASEPDVASGTQEGEATAQTEAPVLDEDEVAAPLTDNPEAPVADTGISSSDLAQALEQAGLNESAETVAEAEAAAEAQAQTNAEGELDAEAQAQADANAQAQADAVSQADQSTAAAAAGEGASGNEPEVVEETVTADEVRSSTEDFANSVTAAPTDISAQELEDAKDRARDNGRDAERARTVAGAALLGLGAVALNEILKGDEKVVSNSGDRVVIEDNGNFRVLRNDDVLLRRPGADVTTYRYDDGSTRNVVTYEDGTVVETIKAADGRVLRRSRTLANGNEVVLFDDTQATQEVVINDLPQVNATRPRERVVYRDTNDTDALARALSAQEVQGVNRTFSLNQVRNIEKVRQLVPEVTVDTINFETNSAAIRAVEAEELSALGNAMRDAIDRNPGEVFLIEGHTDAVGNYAYNLALSDRRAESVALALTEYFQVPPENMILQGYGESDLVVPTTQAERANRRAAVRRITPLLQAQN